MDRKEFDVTDYDGMARIIEIFHPPLIIHTGGYTDVDGAERDWRQAMAVNFVGTENLARICQNEGCELLYLSTDYVFDGEKESPYYEEDEPNPINLYGWSKLGGEYAILSRLKHYYIIRTSFLFGARGDFIDRILTGIKSGRLSFVPGNFAAPTYYPDLAKAIVELITTRRYGIYHLSNQGFCSRYRFATAVLNRLGIDVEIIPMPPPRDMAPRPHYSVLSSSRWQKSGLKPLRFWQDALHHYLTDFH